MRYTSFASLGLVLALLLLSASCTTGPTAADVAAGSWAITSNQTFDCGGNEDATVRDSLKGLTIVLTADGDAVVLSGPSTARFEVWGEQVVEGAKNWYSEAEVASDGSRQGLLVAENGSGITWMSGIKRSGCAAASGSFVFAERQ